MIFTIGVRDTYDAVYRSHTIEYYCTETPDEEENLELDKDNYNDWENEISELSIMVSASNPLEAFIKGIPILHNKLTEEYGRGIWEFYKES